MRVEIGYDRGRDEIVGRCLVGADDNGAPFYITERIGGVQELTREIARRLFLKERARSGISGDEVGFWGWAKKAWKKAKKAATKIAKKVKVYGVLKKVVTTAKKAVKVARKIYEHPAFAAAVGVVSASVPGGAAIAAGYAGSRAALAIIDKLQAGDPQALATIGGYAAQALKGSPEGKKAMALFESVKSTTAPVSAAANPWLKNLTSGISF